MIFFLGTHQPHWLSRSLIPLCVSRRTIGQRKTMPEALVPWLLDSGGFTEVTKYGGWNISPREYLEEVRRISAAGLLAYVAQQDWMCEPVALKATGKTVQEHQRLTVENFLELRGLAPDLPVFPTLQGWEPDDYLRHWEQFEAVGVSLEAEPLVGVGSVCRRQSSDEIAGLFERLQPLKMHGFGVKAQGLKKAHQWLSSADSLAWSFGARHKPPLPGCTGHKNCANCWEYARKWYHEKIEPILEGT